jgi:hypothetical protein
MRIRCAIFGLLLCVTARSGQAQVIHLPTQRVFRVDTTVSVPDRGQSLLGGVLYGRSATVHRGVPLVGRLPGVAPGLHSGAYASELGTNQVHVQATLIDLQAMDEALLAPAVSRDGSSRADSALERKARFLTRHVARDATQPAPGHIGRR